MRVNITATRKLSIIPTLIIAIVGYFAVVVFLKFLHHNFLQSDVLGYWQDSINWATPFHSFHVPGYPLLIAFVQMLSFMSLPPLETMWFINLVSYIACFYLIYKIVIHITDNADIALGAALTFCMWPFVGITYTAIPLADVPAIALFLLGIYFLQQYKMLPAGLLMGLAMVTHKATWIFVLLVFIFDLVRRKEFLSRRNLLFIICAILPLSILWGFGAIHHNSITWLVANNLNVEISSHSNFPILDGILGTFFEGGMKGLAKGSILLGFMVIGIISMLSNINRLSGFRYWGAAVSLSILVLFCILNQHEIWAAVRFSRLLVIPFVIGLSGQISNWISHRYSKAAVVSLLSLAFLSQFVYSWYIARVYFG